MADASFDAVIIGGGKEGLVMGCYLGLNGMTVGIFEQGNELGGAACTRPVPVAGFLGNPHAEVCAFWMSPAYYDFNLGDKGLEFIFPDVPRYSPTTGASSSTGRCSGTRTRGRPCRTLR